MYSKVLHWHGLDFLNAGLIHVRTFTTDRLTWKRALWHLMDPSVGKKERKLHNVNVFSESL